MRIPLALVAGLLLSAPVMAAMPPEHYEAARRDAVDVIVIAVAGVAPPAGEADFGPCNVVGTVLRVERGTRYRIGDPVSLAVDCAAPGAQYPDGGAIYQELQPLLASTYGRAFLGPDGTILLSQYDQLTEAGLP
jgi:hypothetical protein